MTFESWHYCAHDFNILCWQLAAIEATGCCSNVRFVSGTCLATPSPFSPSWWWSCCCSGRSRRSSPSGRRSKHSMLQSEVLVRFSLGVGAGAFIPLLHLCLTSLKFRLIKTFRFHWLTKVQVKLKGTKQALDEIAISLLMSCYTGYRHYGVFLRFSKSNSAQSDAIKWGYLSWIKDKFFASPKNFFGSSENATG